MPTLTKFVSSSEPKSKVKAIGLALFLSLIVLLIGMLGGVWGFLILSNTENESVQNFRRSIGLSDNPAIPSIQTVQLNESSATIDAVEKVSPSVVSVATTIQYQDFFGNFEEKEGVGSGFIFSSDGYILTNKHVVEGFSTVSVILNDGQEYEAQVVSLDPLNDLAVLKIDAKDLPILELGNSDELKIGQRVIAVGNAFGEFSNTVTTGVVSAKDRKLPVSSPLGQDSQLTQLIQTDAAINPGNSGGPLVDLSGRVVGINTAIASASGSSSGVGFSIPVNSFKGVVESVKKNGKIVRPVLGIRYIAISKALAERNNLAVQYGALVSRGETASAVAVLKGSPADKAGIVEGDIVLSINGEDITIDNQLAPIIAQYQVGDVVELELFRNGKEEKIKVTLEEYK